MNFFDFLYNIYTSPEVAMVVLVLLFFAFLVGAIAFWGYADDEYFAARRDSRREKVFFYIRWLVPVIILLDFFVWLPFIVYMGNEVLFK